jgi:hypothetical protein
LLSLSSLSSSSSPSVPPPPISLKPLLHRLDAVLKNEAQAHRVNNIFTEQCVVPSSLDSISRLTLKEMNVPLGVIDKLCEAIDCLRKLDHK